MLIASAVGERRRAAVIAAGTAALGALMLAGACASEPEPVSEPQYSYRQAVAMVQQRIEETSSQLSPKPQFEPLGVGDVPCSGWRDEEGTRQVMYERGGRLNGLEATENRENLASLKEYWNVNGYTLSIDDSATLKNGWVVAARDPMGFKVRLAEGTAGSLHILVQSPCVYPEDSLPTSRAPAR